MPIEIDPISNTPIVLNPIYKYAICNAPDSQTCPFELILFTNVSNLMEASYNLTPFPIS